MFVITEFGSQIKILYLIESCQQSKLLIIFWRIFPVLFLLKYTILSISNQAENIFDKEPIN